MFNNWEFFQNKTPTAEPMATSDIWMPDDTIRDSTKYEPSYYPTYVPKDRYGDPYSYGIRDRLIYGNKPSNVETNVTYQQDSAKGNSFLIEEKMGDNFFRPPTVLNEEQLNQIQTNQAEDDFWRERSDGSGAGALKSERGLIPKIPLPDGLGGIFGGNYVEFKPTGFVNMDFGIQTQRVANPALPIRQQRNTTFAFDPHANVNLIGQVGDKLKISANFDTKANFDFENNFKLEYTGYEEEIIQKIEFGNVSFPLNTSLIQGGQNLFGIYTHLQFGRLSVKAVYSNQRARAEQIRLEGEGGAQRRNFEIRADQYDVNRHFFIGHYFRDNYESSLSTLPMITSGVTITRLEVYVTNRVNNTQTTRNIVAFTDLGESNRALNPTNPNIAPIIPNSPASNDANRLFTTLSQNANTRNSDQVSQTLVNTFQLRKGDDFEILRTARKLTERDYTFQPELGYISLLTPLKNDEILAVAYEYTLNGQVYKVGELSEDYQARPDNEVVFLKLLRPASIRLDLPTWDLMMKNVYQLGASQINQQNFQLRVVYRDDITGLDNPSLQEGTTTKDVPLLQLLNLDRLNQQNDPQRDGNFDFVENVTIDSRNGRVFFPVLEPFGSHLEQQFNAATEQNLISKYVFTQLYESTFADALQDAGKNKFFIKGRYEAAASSDVSLNGLNIAEGSVVVTAGNTPLVEGTDYTVNYATGQVQIINEAILNSGKEITIDYEKADLFNFQVRRLMGVRLDYRFDKDFNIGATLMNLNERPVITRNNVGSDPTNNTIWGMDLTYKRDSRFLTRLVDKIPLIQTKEKSTIDFYGEFAQLVPGASPLSGQVAFIDDFEGTRTAFNLVRSPHINWRLGATPQQFLGGVTQGTLDVNYRRAKIAWYNIDNVFYRDGFNGKPDNITTEDLENHYTRAVIPQEIFQNRQRLQLNTNEVIFDLAFFPNERGPYNFSPNLEANGNLPNPEQNWGAITKAITSDIDFDNANVEYIEFWLLDPFLPGENGRVLDGQFNTNNTTGGDLYINLGNISEDVMPDGRHFFENGLPIEGASDINADPTTWGLVPRTQYLTNAFDNATDTRGNQDVGLDGLRNDQEAAFFQDFVNNATGLNADARAILENDPSADNFRYYLGGEQDAANLKILERYKDFNGTDGNSPITNSPGNFTPSATNEPDNEDLNIDNTINDVESYYQYRVPLRPGQLRVGQNYIVDEVQAEVNGERVSWYLFRIPIRQPDSQVGNIADFKSIRFMRMFLTNFQQPVVLRFAQYQLVANTWRRFLNDLSDPGFSLPNEPYDANFLVTTVNIEENGQGNADNTPYVLPPGVIRDQDVTAVNINRQINEQSLELRVSNLRDKDARAVFKNINMDFLSYKRFNMYIHAESEDAQDEEVTAFVRLGTDFTENYYEVEVPLILTPVGTSGTQAELIWPLENQIDIGLEDMINVKIERNTSRQGTSITIPYTQQVGRYNVTVVGNPDLSSVQTVMIGVRNPDQGTADDRLPKSAKIWVNEMRVTGFDQTAGWAALGRMNVTLADFAQITSSIRYTTFGFGSINDKISDRTRDNTLEFDISANVALDKFLPEEWGIKIPMFVSYERENVSPRFNPLDPDVTLQTYLDNLESDEERRQYRRTVETNISRRSINFTNIRKEKTNPDKKNRFYDISNFAFTYAFSEEQESDANTENYLFQSQRLGVTYAFTSEAKPIKPFEKIGFLKSPYLALIKDFNFNLMPTSILVRADLHRTFAKTQLRGADLTSTGVEPLYEKQFTFNRLYDVQWNLTENLTLSYNANAQAVIDEPFGELDTQEKIDSVRNNLLNLGRMKNFQQQISANYQVPLDKIPYFDFLNVSANYNVGYNWQAGPLNTTDDLGNTFGNTIQNNRERGINGRIDLTKLYNNFKFFKRVNTPMNITESTPDSVKRKERQFNIIRSVVRPFLAVRSINLTYTIQERTTMAGFLPTPLYFGMDSSFAAPGWDFILGGQDPTFRERAVREGWITENALLNTPFAQDYQENLAVRANIEPIKDLRILIDAQRRRSVGYQELLRYNRDTDQFESQNPVRTGSYSVSFLSIRTAFDNSNNSENTSPAFQRFSENRNIILERLRQENTNAGDYNINSQDVLIPAFLAAYSGTGAEGVSLSPFPNIPLPNWRVDYAGLAKVAPFKNIFASINLTHSYSSTYTVGNFTSSLEYGQEFVDINTNDYEYLVPFQLNDEGEYIPINVVNQVAISEKFAPLVGVNLRTKSNFTLRLDYNRQRDLALNITNAQVTERNSQDFIVGVGFIKKGLKLPFKNREGKQVVLKNDVNFRLDFSIRDSKTVQRKLDDVQTLTAGNVNIQIKPVISYIANQRLNIQLYYDRSINRPRVSSSFPRTNTAFGFQVRYNLTQ